MNGYIAPFSLKRLAGLRKLFYSQMNLASLPLSPPYAISSSAPVQGRNSMLSTMKKRNIRHLEVLGLFYCPIESLSLHLKRFRWLKMRCRMCCPRQLWRPKRAFVLLGWGYLQGQLGIAAEHNIQKDRLCRIDTVFIIVLVLSGLIMWIWHN